MTCRHKANDPACSSYQDRQGYLQTPIRQETPDPTEYKIVEAAREGTNLILKVLYPNCEKCAFEGNKVLVFLNVTEVQALKWGRIDPHFRGPSRIRVDLEAPSPAARFPASEEGWKDAIAYARLKSGKMSNC